MTIPPFRIAVMGGSYGNVPALQACLDHAATAGCNEYVFLGDAIGCCGHSDEVLDLIHDRFPVRVAGNHEQQAAAGAETCGCGYDSAEDEKWGCVAFDLAIQSLGDLNRKRIATWPDEAVLPTPAGNLLLCHGSPDQTNEFLYESQLDDARLIKWLDRHDAVGLLCTHTGLPWVRALPDDRFASNVGVTGKPDHDGDPAVHYALVDAGSQPPTAAIQSVTYDHHAWAKQLDREGIPSTFTTPLRTGIWTTGQNSLPDFESRRSASIRTG